MRTTESDLILRAFDDADRWGPEPADSSPDDGLQDLAPPPIPAGYEIIREIHRGGQGVVYEATQCSTRRRVAIKVMHAAARLREAEVRRFEREAALLTQLRHPSVVTVYDAGVAAGSCYIIMDFIDGAPIDRFVREARTSLRERLGLFAAVCDAVHAAHVRGVIHRDLKPANILVRRTQGAPEPIVLDFGLAKQDGVPVDSEVTVAGEFVGSLPWASPEQAAGDPSRIDIRTDVYSLGVILYHLLTGSFPYDVVGPIRDVLNRIVTADPVPLTIPAELSAGRLIDDDIGVIALKCLKKEPAQRYQLAGELAADLRRCLAGEAIEAKRDSTAYLLRVSLRRHRVVLMTTTMFAIVLGAATVVSVRWWLQAQRQSQLAEQEHANAEQTAKVMENLLTAADPWIARGRDAGFLREILDMTLVGVRSGQYVDAPEVELRLRLSLGWVYAQLDDLETAHELLDPAEALARSIYPADHEQAARTLLVTGGLLWWDRKFDDALAHYRAALDMQQRLHPGDHDTVADAMRKVGFALFYMGQYHDALPISRAAFEMMERLHGSDSLEAMGPLNDVACCLLHLERPVEALPEFETALRVRRRLLSDGHPDHPDVAISLRNLGDCRFRLGQAAQALPLMKQAATMMESLFDPNHPAIGQAHLDVAECLAALRQHEDALSEYRRARTIFEKAYKNDHLFVIECMDRIAACLLELGNTKDAIGTASEALALVRGRVGSSLEEKAAQLLSCAQTLLAAGQLSEAETAACEALEAFRAHPDRDADRRSAAERVLALARLEQGDGPAALATSEDAERSARSDPESPRRLQASLALKGYVLLRQGGAPAAERAIPALRESLALCETCYLQGHPLEWIRSNTMSMLGAALAEQGDFDQAEPLVVGAFENLMTDTRVPSRARCGVDLRSDACDRVFRLYEAMETAPP